MRRTFAALALLVAACGRELPAPDDEERAALEAAAAVPPEPSAGCRTGVLPTARGRSAGITVAGSVRTYVLDAPGGAADRPRPLVLAFHGFRGRARGFRAWGGWKEVARRDDVIVVHPEGHEGVRVLSRNGRGWDVLPVQREDATLVGALLDRIERERCVDRRRLYATGMSNGGFFANLLGCLLADRLAAVAAVAGAMPLHACRPARPIPVLLVYGAADRLVPPETVRLARDWWARVDGCQGRSAREGCVHGVGCAAAVVACEGPQGHRWPADATARIWRFFQAHPRS